MILEGSVAHFTPQVRVKRALTYSHLNNRIEDHAGGAGDASGIRRLEESRGPFYVAWPV